MVSIMPPAPPGFYNPPGTNYYIPIGTSEPSKTTSKTTTIISSDPAPAASADIPANATTKTEESRNTGKTVLVTVGATVPFPALTDSALTPEFLEALVNLGFGKLQLQHGVYTPRIPDLSIIDIANTEEKTGVESEQQANGRINIETFAFDKDLALNYIAKADLVVTHAGAGSVLECLRWDKRTIVVENSSLMGGHQRELIEELEGQGYVVEGKLGELEKAVQKIMKDGGTKKMQRGRGISQVIGEEMGEGWRQEG